MPARPVASLLAALLLLAPAAIATEVHRPDREDPVPRLIDTISARHHAPLAGYWTIVIPEKVVETGPTDTPVVITLYGLRDAQGGVRALLLTQRNVLPGPSGWGPPSLCTTGSPLLRLDVYQSPRDVLCAWMQPVSFAPTGHAHIATLADLALNDADRSLAAQADHWLLSGWRVSNRHDFLDLQLLLPADPARSTEARQQFLADIAHSLDATWLSGEPVPVPMPMPPPPKAATPTQAGSWWSGSLSLSAMRTATYRVGVSIKTFAVASLMAGDAATGGAIIGILNVTSTGIYLINDYVWETWTPLTPPPQDFVRLVEAE